MLHARQWIVIAIVLVRPPVLRAVELKELVRRAEYVIGVKADRVNLTLLAALEIKLQDRGRSDAII